MLLNVDDLFDRNWQAKGLTIDAFDESLLVFYQAVLDKFPDAYVNISNGARKHNWCGYRTPDCKEGADNSTHRRGKALDMHRPGGYAKNKELYDWCLEHGAEYGIKRMEDEACTLKNKAGGWVHADVVEPSVAQKARTEQMKNGIYVFKP